MGPHRKTGRRLAALAVAAGVLGGVDAAGGQAPGAAVSIVGGTLQVTEDPGVAGQIGVYYYPSTATYTVDIFGGSLRPGAGCGEITAQMTSCPAADVQRLSIDSGDLDDQLFPGGDHVFQTGSAPLPIPVSVTLGPGNDGVHFRLSAQPVTVDAGADNDFVNLGLGAYPDESIASARVDLGPGDDESPAYGVLGGVEIAGGEGGDRIEIVGGRGTAVVDGGPGVDVLTARGRTTPTELRGGDGRDALVDSFGERGDNGPAVMRAGAGADRILLNPDHDRDTIDCGPGRDLLDVNNSFEHATVPLNNRYVNCPPVGVRLPSSARLSGAGIAILAVTARGASRATARVLRPGGRSAGPEVRGLRLRRGRTAIRLRLRPGQLHSRRGRFLVRLTATASGGDHIVLRRRVLLTRSG